MLYAIVSVFKDDCPYYNTALEFYWVFLGSKKSSLDSMQQTLIDDGFNLSPDLDKINTVVLTQPYFSPNCSDLSPYHIILSKLLAFITAHFDC